MKVLRVILCIFLCGALISGCDTVKLNVSNKSPLAPVTLNFLWIGDEPPSDKEILKEVAEKSNLNILLNFKWLSSNDYTKNIESMITTSSTPIDGFIIGGNDDASGLSYSSLANKGELLDLSNLFLTNAPNIYKKLSKEDLASIKVNGKIYAIPSLNLLAESEGVQVRKDLMEKYNMSSINNLDDLEVYLANVKKNEKNIIPLNVVPTDTEFYARLYGYVALNDFTNLVYKLDDPKMKLIPFEDTEAFKDVIRRLTSWVDKGYLVFNNENQSDVAAFLDGHQYIEQDSKISSSAYPSGADAHTYLLNKTLPIVKTSPIYTMNENAGIAISIKSKNAARTLKFINWVQGNIDNYNLLVHGRLGTEYTLDKGLISYTPLPNNASTYQTWNAAPFRNLNYEIKNFMPATSLPNLSQALNVLNSKAVYAPHSGFSPDYSTIEEALTTRSNLYNKEVAYALYQGNLKYSDIDKIREDLKGAGTDNIVNTLQSQLDTFIINKK